MNLAFQQINLLPKSDCSVQKVELILWDHPRYFGVEVPPYLQ